MYGLPHYIYFLCVTPFISLFSFLFMFFLLFEILWVYLLQTLTRPHSSTWVTKGFKGLIVYAKCNRGSYDSELDFRVLFLVLLEDEQKLVVGVFVSMIYDPILYPYLPNFWFI